MVKLSDVCVGENIEDDGRTALQATYVCEVMRGADQIIRVRLIANRSFGMFMM